MRDELVGLEKQFWQAAGDPGFYRRRFADDGVMAFHVGVMSKDDVVAAMDGAEEWESFTIDDLQVVELSDTVASLTYTTVARPVGGNADYRAAVTSVYARRGGQWMLVVHQQTPLA